MRRVITAGTESGSGGPTRPLETRLLTPICCSVRSHSPCRRTGRRPSSPRSRRPSQDRPVPPPGRGQRETPSDPPPAACSFSLPHSGVAESSCSRSARTVDRRPKRSRLALNLIEIFHPIRLNGRESLIPEVFFDLRTPVQVRKPPPQPEPTGILDAGRKPSPGRAGVRFRQPRCRLCPCAGPPVRPAKGCRSGVHRPDPPRSVDRGTARCRAAGSRRRLRRAVEIRRDLER